MLVFVVWLDWLTPADFDVGTVENLVCIQGFCHFVCVVERARGRRVAFPSHLWGVGGVVVLVATMPTHPDLVIIIERTERTLTQWLGGMHGLIV